jgi:ATP-binding cassette subfamily B protein
VLDAEPEHPAPDVAFSHHESDRSPFTLRSFLRPVRGPALVALLLVVVETATLQAGPLLTQIGIDRGISNGDLRVVLIAAGVFLAAIGLNVVASGARISYTGHLGERLMEMLRIRVFAHLQRLSLDYYTGERSGRVMTRMTSDIDALTALFQDGLVNLAVQGFTLVIITAVLVWMSPMLALITIGVVVPIMLALTLWFRSASERGYAEVRDRIAEVLTDLAESLAGIRVIAAHNRRRRSVEVHEDIVDSHLHANLYTARVGAIYGPASDGVGIVGQAVVLGVGAWMVLGDRLTLGELSAFVLYLTAFFAPVQQLVQLYNTYQSGQAAVTKLRDLLATDPSVPEDPDAVTMPPIDGAISLRDVTFAFEPGRDVLHAVDLDIAPGETFALVGPTGAGKSTIAKLMARFYDPSSGTVTIDGHDLRSVSLTSLRSQLGLVPQEPFLFHGTVRDNLTFAAPDTSDEDIMAACQELGIDDLVARLPAGLDTPVFERGSSLSAGERQLLALGRAFMARPRVLILDEATSNIDLAAERRIERAFDTLLANRTAVIVAHRLATAMRADRIGVVEHGTITEIGTHDELVALGGYYASVVARWESHAGEQVTP